MEFAFPLGQYSSLTNSQLIRNAIDRKLTRFLDTIPTYKVKKLSISASWQVWVRLEVNTTKLDYPKGDF